MNTGSSGRTALIVALGLLVWALLVVGFGRVSEDTCLADVEKSTEARAYSTQTSLFPPRFECELSPPDPPTVVSHPLRAWTRFAIVVGFPIAGLGFVVVSMQRRRAPSNS